MLKGRTLYPLHHWDGLYYKGCRFFTTGIFHPNDDYYRHQLPSVWFWCGQNISRQYEEQYSLVDTWYNLCKDAHILWLLYINPCRWEQLQLLGSLTRMAAGWYRTGLFQFWLFPFSLYQWKRPSLKDIPTGSRLGDVLVHALYNIRRDFNVVIPVDIGCTRYFGPYLINWRRLFLWTIEKSSVITWQTSWYYMSLDSHK